MAREAPDQYFDHTGAFVNNFNTETAPDIIGKTAFDPGWGHFEAFGLVRFFTDSVFTCSVVGAGGVCPRENATERPQRKA